MECEHTRLHEHGHWCVDETEEEEEPAPQPRAAGRRGAAVKKATAAPSSATRAGPSKATTAGRAGRAAGKGGKKGTVKGAPKAGATLDHLFSQAQPRAAASKARCAAAATAAAVLPAAIPYRMLRPPAEHQACLAAVVPGQEPAAVNTCVQRPHTVSIQACSVHLPAARQARRRSCARSGCEVNGRPYNPHGIFFWVGAGARVS